MKVRGDGKLDGMVSMLMLWFTCLRVGQSFPPQNFAVLHFDSD